MVGNGRPFSLRQSARDAVVTHIEGMLLDGEHVPPPTSIDARKENPDYAGG
ncbi:MAG: type II toxin-antitoxin system HicB family antitoxin [Desulfobacteria bacterium]